ncbi:hypothetical protein RAF69_26685, partial [Klebsiella pneumoniae]
RAYCLKTQPATGETYPKSDLFNKAAFMLLREHFIHIYKQPDKMSSHIKTIFYVVLRRRRTYKDTKKAATTFHIALF